MGVEEVRYLIDKMLSRTPDRLIRLTQVYSQVFFVVCVNFRHLKITIVFGTGTFCLSGTRMHSGS